MEWKLFQTAKHEKIYSLEIDPFRIQIVSTIPLWWLALHCCIVVHFHVIQQQNIFFSWMNRPLNDSSRRINPVQFWKLLNIFKKFNLFFNLFFKFFCCCNFYIFFAFLKTLLLDLTMKEQPSDPSENMQV